MGKKGVKKPKKTGRRKVERTNEVWRTEGQPDNEGQDQAVTGRTEGDRTEADRQPGSSVISQSNAQGEVYAPKEDPSQAEGDRETVEEDLREKGQSS